MVQCSKKMVPALVDWERNRPIKHANNLVVCSLSGNYGRLRCHAQRFESKSMSTMRSPLSSRVDPILKQSRKDLSYPVTSTACEWVPKQMLALTTHLRFPIARKSEF